MDTIQIEFDHRHALCFDTAGDLHPFCAYRLDRLCRAEPYAALPTMAGHRVRFAVFHVERFTAPLRIFDPRPAHPPPPRHRLPRPLRRSAA